VATWDELAALRPGATVRVGDEEFLIERTICFEEGASAWWEHRLSSDSSGRSLWLEIATEPEKAVIAYDSSTTLDFVPDGGREIEHGGERLRLLLSGRAMYRSIERSAAPKSGELVYHEYAAGDRHVTYECRSESTVWEVSEGREIDAADVEIVA
jgi:hypothetical protein